MTITHDMLVEAAAAWLRSRCSVVITEMSHLESETPDAIGWRSRESILIECKASRADYLADRWKPFRRDPERGMGHTRYYCAPAGMLKPEELPEGWGLLELRAGRLRVAKQPAKKGLRANQGAEITLLLSALRRIGQTVSPRAFTADCQPRAMPGTADEALSLHHSAIRHDVAKVRPDSGHGA